MLLPTWLGNKSSRVSTQFKVRRWVHRFHMLTFTYKKGKMIKSDRDRGVCCFSHCYDIWRVAPPVRTLGPHRTACGYCCKVLAKVLKHTKRRGDHAHISAYLPLLPWYNRLSMIPQCRRETWTRACRRCSVRYGSAISP